MERTQFGRTMFSILAALCIGQQYLHAIGFVVTDLVSDIPGQAAHLDPNLVNPWGIALSPTSPFWVPFWVANNRTGVSTLYDGVGTTESRNVTGSKRGSGDGDSRTV